MDNIAYIYLVLNDETAYPAPAPKLGKPSASRHRSVPAKPPLNPPSRLEPDCDRAIQYYPSFYL